MKRTRSDDGLSPSPKKQKTSHGSSPVHNRVATDESVHNYNSSQDENGSFLILLRY